MKLWREYVWETRLSPEQCAERLRHATERDEFWRGRSGDPVGTLYRSGEPPFFCVRAPAGPLDRNPLEPRFQGRFVETPVGTRIRGCFEVHPFAVAVLAAWFLISIPLAGIIVLILVNQALRTGSFGGFGMLLGASFPFLAAGMLMYAWRKSAPQRRRLEEFVRNAFDANLLEAPAESSTGVPR